MSELKVHRFITTDELFPEANAGVLYYEKSEADKVIEELKRQIEFLKVTTDSCKNCGQCADGMGKVFDKEFNPLKDKLRREKYKRCLAMASRCFTKSNYHFVLARHGEDVKKNNRRSVLYSKWRQRWLAIADKFKPNSTINRKEATNAL